jgi:hypothetical protein
MIEAREYPILNAWLDDASHAGSAFRPVAAFKAMPFQAGPVTSSGRPLSRIVVMIELLISACLTTGPVCRDFSLLFDNREVSLMTCMISGQAVIAPWQQGHPEWQVQRWLCRHAERREVSL